MLRVPRILLIAAAAGLSLVQPALGGEPIRPLPDAPALDPARVELGERLFHDTRLSHGGTQSCAVCHPLDRGGMDGLPRSVTSLGVPDVVNAPTIFNAEHNFRLTWRGAFRTLAEHLDAELQNPRHAAMSWPEIIRVLGADAGYRERFGKVYPAGLARASVLDALVSFERSLVTPDCRFDRYLKGERDAINEREREGYRRFKVYGCVACHQGVNVGGNLFQRIGVFANYFVLRGGPIGEPDLGLYTITGRDDDRYIFRVPSLRNVALTAPYFHDGSVATLPEAIALMGRLQLGRELSTEDIDLIDAFLQTLTGAYRARRTDHGG